MPFGSSGGLFGRLTLKNTIIAVIGVFFLVEIASLLLNSAFPTIPLIKGGTALLLILVAAAVISVFVLAINLEQLKQKENLIFTIIVLGLVVAGFYYLPKYFPQLFSISPGLPIEIKSTIASIFGGG
jgi:hypothetical protein